MFKRLFLIIFFGLFLASSVFAGTFYTVSVDKNDEVTLSALLTITSEKSVNYWDITWIMPSNTTLINIKDTLGPIEDYSLSGRQLSIRTNSGSRRSSEILEIELKGIGVVNKEFFPVKTLELSLPGFPDQVTKVDVAVDGLLGGSVSLGFSQKFREGLFSTKGKGPINLKIVYSDQKPQFDHFLVTPFYDLFQVEELYFVPQNFVGFNTSFPYFSIIVLPDESYNQVANEWNEGIYRGAGIILIRQSSMKKNTNISIILHEITHGFNEKFLKWDQSDQQWFDEGTAKYIEFLVNQKLKIPSPQVFGDSFKFEKGNKRFIMPPRQTKQDLVNYYHNGNNFMFNWSPNNPKTREFGYSFSELLIRKYLLSRNQSDLHGTYQKLLNQKEVIQDSLLSTQLILDAMESDMVPCFDTNSDKIVYCLEEIVAGQYKLPSSSLVLLQNDSAKKNLVEKETEKVVDELAENSVDDKEKELSFLEQIFEFFRSLFASLGL